MRRIILLSLLALVVLGDAHAQHRGGIGLGFARGGVGARSPIGFNRARFATPYSSGYGFLSYDGGTSYVYPSQPLVLIQPPPTAIVQEPPREVHPVTIDYKRAPAPSESELQSFGIVLKDGSTLSATTIVASGNVLHYVDPEERFMRVSMSQVDREATLKLNRERKLTLHLPATPQSTTTQAPSQ
jgi:hypothetical protein